MSSKFNKSNEKRIQRRPLKITTRITLSNVLFFTLVITLITIFVFVLTQKFLFLKNRDELYVKRDQIEDYFTSEEERLSATPSDQRLKVIYDDLRALYLFDHYKYIAFIYNTNDESSYAFEKTYYDKLFLSYFDLLTNELTFTYAFENVEDQSWMTFHINESDDQGDLSRVATAFIPLPQYEDEKVINQISFLGENILETTLMVSYEDDSPIYLTLFLFPQYDRAFIIILMSALVVSSLIGILLIIFFGRYFAMRALSPLVNLSNRAKQIEVEDLREPIPVRGTNDEIDSLIQSLNAMMQNLNRSFENQRRFISDASHELRIPITVLMGYSELLKTSHLDDRALLEESIDAIDTEAKSMKYLVEKLLLLARADSNRIPIKLEKVPIKSLYKRLSDNAEKLYPDLHLSYVCDEEDAVYADQNLLVQAFRALIDNAYKYANSSEGIQLSVTPINDQLSLNLTDYGPGIPSEALDHLTERFYRVESDRNRDTGGSGLGLSIVKALISSQNGTIEIHSQVDKGTTISILLPQYRDEQAL